MTRRIVRPDAWVAPFKGADLRGKKFGRLTVRELAANSGPPAYQTRWAGMLSRCNNPNVECFPDYGGRGIKVCERWLNLENFIADMGRRPSSGHSLERDDVNGNYEPGNVRWATAMEQGNNRRDTRYVVYRGGRMSLANAVRLAGSVIHREAAWSRIRTGWSVERALETPRTMESLAARANKRQREGWVVA